MELEVDGSQFFRGQVLSGFVEVLVLPDSCIIEVPTSVELGDEFQNQIDFGLDQIKLC